MFCGNTQLCNLGETYADFCYLSAADPSNTRLHTLCKGDANAQFCGYADMKRWTVKDMEVYYYDLNATNGNHTARTPGTIKV